MSDPSASQKLFEEGLLKKSLETVAAALDAGLPINDPWDNEAPLHRAVGTTHAQGPIVELLLARGADPNLAQAGTERYPLMSGRTPLMLAACFGHLGIAELLLGAGADVNRRSLDGCGPLYYASNRRFEKLFRRLLAAGALATIQDFWGVAATGNPRMLEPLLAAGFNPNAIVLDSAPLHATVVYDNLPNCLVLLRAGADPHLRLPDDFPDDSRGAIPLDIAERLKMKKFVKVFKDAMRGVIPEPTLPKAVTPDDLPEVWKALEKALGKERGDVKKSLNRGTTEAALAKLEHALGVPLPADVRASFLRHNGQKDGADGLFPDGFLELPGEFVLLDLGGSLDEWNTWKKLDDEGELRGQQSEPAPGVRDGWWDPKWIPLAANGGGDALCVDLAPAEGGVPGQVLLMSHDSPSRPLLAGSWTALLSLLAEDMS